MSWALEICRNLIYNIGVGRRRMTWETVSSNRVWSAIRAGDYVFKDRLIDGLYERTGRYGKREMRADERSSVAL
jgi:hypothetical protein